MIERVSVWLNLGIVWVSGIGLGLSIAGAVDAGLVVCGVALVAAVAYHRALGADERNGGTA